MPECKHSWVQLISKALENRLLSDKMTAVDVFGCCLCGAVRGPNEGHYDLKNIKNVIDWEHEYTANVDIQYWKMAKPYWHALIRFAGLD